MPLEEYRRKRSFDKTSEPRAEAASASSGRRFCLQSHDASRLHYDFRLELNGVLKSWAVPKGPSLKPGEKRLAVPTEDHPLSYLTWEGTIPAGQYGGGVVMVFDLGDWEPLEDRDPEQSLSQGELKIRLWGQKLQGDWTMVRTQKNSWLWLKKHDAWVDDDWSPEEHLWSAVSGRSFGEVERGLGAPAPRASFPKGAFKAPLPLEVQPMLASLSSPFSDPDWLFEVKWDGIRALAFCQEQSPRLTNRAGHSLTESFPELKYLRSRFQANSFIADGELVVLDDQGRPEYTKIVQKLKAPGARSIARLSRASPAVYYVFDLLYLDGRDLRGLSLEKRRQLLASILREDSRVRLSETVVGEGEALYAAAVEQGLEGLVAKNRQSTYQAGRSSQWLEIKSRSGREREEEPVAVTRDFREVDGRQVPFSNPHKVLFPQKGYDKARLAEYYEQVAPLILPHLADRPLSLRRFPDGVEGPEFFQKHPGSGVPDWVRREETEHGEALMVDDRATLSVLSNLAAIELHVTLSRYPELKVPDGLVIDFDPQSLGFSEVKKVVISAGKLLSELRWTAYLKTSGGRGLHVFIPVAPGYTFEQTRLMAGVIGEILLQQHPKKVTLERTPARRPRGTVYVDAPQNRYTSTMACAYTVRANAYAGVSMPLAWKELESDVAPQDFTLREAAQRAAKTAELWSTLPLKNQRIEDVLPLLEALTTSLHESSAP